MRVNTPDFIKAVELANSLRDALGATKLRDLPKGSQRDAKRCILARAFNFECSVGSAEGRWFVSFPEMELEKMDALTQWATDNGLEMSRWSNRAFLLPKAVGNIAANFDLGLLPEYVDQRSNR